MNRARHESHCTVCQRPDHGEIEAAFLAFESPRAIEKRLGLPESCVYRHAKAMSLYDKRQGNLVGALEKIIERGLTTMPDVTMTNVIEAIKTHAKLTGQWIDRTQDLPAEFASRSDAELEHYARHGTWPTSAWEVVQ